MPARCGRFHFQLAASAVADGEQANAPLAVEDMNLRPWPQAQHRGQVMGLVLGQEDALPPVLGRGICPGDTAHASLARAVPCL